MNEGKWLNQNNGVAKMSQQRGGFSFAYEVQGRETIPPTERELQEQMSVRGMTTAYSFHGADLLVNPDKRSNASLISSAA